MKLLIVTQKVDVNDDVLGFFHRWIEEIAKHAEVIHVVCLWEGGHRLPKNVFVHSLGKERETSKLFQVKQFIHYVIQLRKEYSSVFVHMNQEYVLVAGVLWRFFGKKIFLWRNHAKGSLLTNVAVYFSHRIFCTSPHSYTARFKKTKIMPVGIDVEIFKPDDSVSKKHNSILFLGRISAVKNVDVFIEVLNELKNRGVVFFATIAGAPSLEDTKYEKEIKERVLEYGLDDSVTFSGPMTHEETPNLYRDHEVYVNLTPPGSLDKTIFEALACGLKVVVANTFFKDKSICWIVEDLKDYKKSADILERALTFKPEEDLGIRQKTETFLRWHRLENLTSLLIAETQ